VSKNMRVKNQYLIVFSVFCIFQVFCVLCANDSGNLRHFKRCLAPRVVWMIGRQKRAFLKQVRVILFVCVWSIWKLWTGKIFNNREINLEEWWIEDVKIYFWNWLHIKSKSLYYITKWFMNLKAFLCEIETWNIRVVCFNYGCHCTSLSSQYILVWKSVTWKHVQVYIVDCILASASVSRRVIIHTLGV
jgi:hypothetical protein